MKKLLPVIFLLLILRQASGQLTLDINITGLKNEKGVIMLQLLNENEKLIGQEKGEIKDKKCTITIKDLKPGKYAVQYYHDENLSGVMETNLVGIPKEGYGFSNNASGPFGPKPFKERLFDLEDNMTIDIITRY